MNPDLSTIITYASVVATVLGTLAAILFGYLGIRFARQQKQLAEKQNQLAEKQNKIALQMQPKKHLRIYIESYVPLIRTSKDVEKEIAVEYRGKTVKNLASLQVKVINVGNTPITPEDFYTPLEFTVKGIIIEARQISASDNSIQLLTNKVLTGDSLQAEKTLLNQGDAVTILFTVSEEEGTPAKESFSAKGRVVDGTLEYLKEKPAKEDIVKSSTSGSTESTSTFLEFAKIITNANNLKKEDWPMLRDIMFIMTLLLIALAMLIDAIIPF
jgi:hypothetical protein